MAQQLSETLAGRRILLGVCGGIAAYKAPELVRQIRAAGGEVRVVTTAAAGQFVTATALQAVSGEPVRTDLWDPAAEAAMGHIELARWADTVLIAPATANCLAKLAHGTADDLLSTLCLATTAPLHIAPAMNVRMWEHPATQANVALLTGRATLLGPGSGPQACGEFGLGRMLEPSELCAALATITPEESEKILGGAQVLITAGPTREAIDPVRYISNRSSGRQGYAIAAAAAALGADVTLVSGPTALPTPMGVTRIDVNSAVEMYAAVMAKIDQVQLFVGVAAVADYRVPDVATQKIKKEGAQATGLTLNLVPNPDIIAAVAARPTPPVTIGFAAETHAGLDHARAKRERKGLDMIVLNDVSNSAIGFRSPDNAVTLIWDEGEEVLPLQSKALISRTLLKRVRTIFGGRLGLQNAPPPAQIQHMLAELVFTNP